MCASLRPHEAFSLCLSSHNTDTFSDLTKSNSAGRRCESTRRIGWGGVGQGVGREQRRWKRRERLQVNRPMSVSVVSRCNPLRYWCLGFNLKDTWGMPSLSHKIFPLRRVFHCATNRNRRAMSSTKELPTDGPRKVKPTAGTARPSAPSSSFKCTSCSCAIHTGST